MLHNIIQVVDKHPALTTKKLNYFRSTLSNPKDSYPSHIPTFDELQKNGSLKPGQSYVALIKVKHLFADNIYKGRTYEEYAPLVDAQLAKEKAFKMLEDLLSKRKDNDYLISREMPTTIEEIKDKEKLLFDKFDKILEFFKENLNDGEKKLLLSYFENGLKNEQ